LSDLKTLKKILHEVQNLQEMDEDLKREIREQAATEILNTPLKSFVRGGRKAQQEYLKNKTEELKSKELRIDKWFKCDTWDDFQKALPQNPVLSFRESELNGYLDIILMHQDYTNPILVTAQNSENLQDYLRKNAIK
jgi:hypothetical protein